MLFQDMSTRDWIANREKIYEPQTRRSFVYCFYILDAIEIEEHPKLLLTCDFWFLLSVTVAENV